MKPRGTPEEFPKHRLSNRRVAGRIDRTARLLRSTFTASSKSLRYRSPTYSTDFRRSFLRARRSTADPSRDPEDHLFRVQSPSSFSLCLSTLVSLGFSFQPPDQPPFLAALFLRASTPVAPFAPARPRIPRLASISRHFIKGETRTPRFIAPSHYGDTSARGFAGINCHSNRGECRDGHRDCRWWRWKVTGRRSFALCALIDRDKVAQSSRLESPRGTEWRCFFNLRRVHQRGL